MNFFVTGTDTNVGKTLVSSLLCLQCGFSYFKPVQTGSEIDSDKITVQKLSKCNVKDEIYRFKAPVSPNLAAKLEGTSIDIQRVKRAIMECNNTIIEGAGGIMVPLSSYPKYTFLNLVSDTTLPVVLVADTRLGVINHILLTINALRSVGATIAAIILNGEKSIGVKETTEEFVGQSVQIYEVPKINDVSLEGLKSIPIFSNLVKASKI